MLEVVKDAFRLLTFRLTRDEFLAFDRRHLIFGLICTWLVGIGRYWDNPQAEFLQHLGVGSVIYIFVLSFFLLVFIAPLDAKDWSYFRVLTFVSLVSPPAILYAIPLEKFIDIGSANTINAWFLLLVASWRVALLLFALKRFFLMGWGSSLVTAFLPLSIIVVALGMLNLEHVVFNIMGGIREPSSPNDSAYGVLLLLLFFSIMLSPILLISYIVLVVINVGARMKPVSNKDESEDQES